MSPLMPLSSARSSLKLAPLPLLIGGAVLALLVIGTIVLGLYTPSAPTAPYEKSVEIHG